MSSCQNHNCTEIIDVDKVDHVICPLCRDATYCSEQCRMIDWPAHECPNAVKTDKVGVQMAVPYFCEDLLPSDVLQAELDNPKSPLNESILFSHVGSDMKLRQWQQPVGDLAKTIEYNKMDGLGRGGAPPRELERAEFTINLFQEGNSAPVASFSGRVGDRAIHKESDNETIQKLARSSFWSEKASSSIVLWPDMQFARGIMVPSKGAMRAQLVLNGKTFDIDFRYRKFSNSSIFRRLSSAVLKHFQSRLRIKFPGRDDAIKLMQSVRATAPNGTQVNLTFSVDPKQDMIELKDVEFSVPRNQVMRRLSDAEERLVRTVQSLPEEVVESMYADPLNMDSMMGLTMALEYASTQIKADLLPPLANHAAFEQAASIVRKHTRSMLDGKTYTSVPMEVNAAVYSAVNALHELQAVEISISKDNVKKYTDKLTRAGRPAQAEALAIQEITPIVEQLEEIRNAAVARPKKGIKSFFKKKIDTAKKSRLDKQLDEWKVAIENYLNAQPEGTKFAKADALIRRGKNPLATTPATSSDDEK